MKITTSILAFLFFSAILFGQKYEYNIDHFGNMEGNISTFVTDVLDWSDAPKYITSVQAFKGFETNLVRKGEDKIIKNKLGAPLKNCYNFETLVIDNRFFKLFLNRNKKDKKLYRVLAEFNSDAQYIDVRYIDTLAYEKKENFPNQQLFSSADSSYFLTIDVIDKNKKNEVFSTLCKVYDSNFNQIRKFKYEKKGKHSQRSTQYLTGGINNNGDVFVVHRLFDKSNKMYKKIDGEKVPAYDLEVTTNLYSKENKKYILKDNNNFISSMKLLFDHENKPIIVGQVLRDQSYDSFVKGLSIHTFKDDQFNSTIHIFDKDQIEDFGNWGGKNKQGIKPNSKINSNYLVSKGEVHFQIENILEEYENDAMGKTLKSVSRSSIVFSISNTGALNDYMHLPKFHQNYYFTIESILFFLGGKPALLYYDKFENLEIDLKDYKKFKEFRGIFGNSGNTALILGYKDENGSVVREHFAETLKMSSNLKCYDYNKAKKELKLLMISDLSVFKKPDVNIFTIKDLH